METSQRDPRNHQARTFRYVDISTIDRETKQIVDPPTILGMDAPSRARKQIQVTDVLVSTVRPNLNAVAMVPEWLDAEIASTGFCVLRANPDVVNARFLYYRVRTPEFVRFLCNRATGASYPAVTDGIVKQAPVALPPLPEQKRIVAILDASEELLRLREQADHRTIDLIPALFHEMFGNRDESATKTLGEIVQSIDSGWSPVCRAESAAANEWGVLKLGAVTTGTYLDSENKALPEEEVPRPGIEVEAGDILFTRKNTKELVAAVAYVWETCPKLLLSDLIFRLRPKVGVGVESVYLAYALKKSDKRREIQSLASGAAGSMPNISKQRLSGIKVFLPPLSLQRAFAARVTGIRGMEVSQSASRRCLDNLFQSLLHRAFKGEL